jgi:hypothetical protein
MNISIPPLLMGVEGKTIFVIWEIHLTEKGSLECEYQSLVKEISILVKGIWSEYRLPLEYIVAATTDGGTEKTAVQKELKLPWLHCAAHITNLVVKEGMK